MKQKEISPVRLLLRWAGPEKKWLIGVWIRPIEVEEACQNV